jgi:hypothetical protein
VDSTGEQAPAQVDIGQDQLGGVHAPQGRHPHLIRRRARQHVLTDFFAEVRGEGAGAGGDSEGVLG